MCFMETLVVDIYHFAGPLVHIHNNLYNLESLGCIYVFRFGRQNCQNSKMVTLGLKELIQFKTMRLSAKYHHGLVVIFLMNGQFNHE
jgi:hypothetical protein